MFKVLFFSDWKIYGFRTAWVNFLVVNGAAFIGAKRIVITYQKHPRERATYKKRKVAYTKASRA